MQSTSFEHWRDSPAGEADGDREPLPLRISQAGGPLCRELWNALSFDMRRPDGGMVAVRGEIAEPQADRTEKTLKKRKKSIYFQKKACNCPQRVL